MKALLYIMVLTVSFVSCGNNSTSCQLNDPSLTHHQLLDSLKNIDGYEVQTELVFSSKIVSKATFVRCSSEIGVVILEKISDHQQLIYQNISIDEWQELKLKEHYSYFISTHDEVE